VHTVLLFSAQDMLVHGPPGGGADIRFSRDALVAIAGTTGGGKYEASVLPMEEVFLRIGERLRAQYLVGYNSISPRPPGKERRIEVKLNREGRYRVSTRSSHFGSQSLGDYVAAEINRGPERRRIVAVRAAALMGDPVAMMAVVGALGQARTMTAGVPREARLALLEMGAPAVPYLRAALAAEKRKLRTNAAEVLVDLLTYASRKGREALDEAVVELGGGSAAVGRQALQGIRDEAISSTSRQRLEQLLGKLGA